MYENQYDNYLDYMDKSDLKYIATPEWSGMIKQLDPTKTKYITSYEQHSMCHNKRSYRITRSEIPNEPDYKMIGITDLKFVAMFKQKPVDDIIFNEIRFEVGGTVIDRFDCYIYPMLLKLYKCDVVKYFKKNKWYYEYPLTFFMCMPNNWMYMLIYHEIRFFAILKDSYNNNPNVVHMCVKINKIFQKEKYMSPDYVLNKAVSNIYIPIIQNVLGYQYNNNGKLYKLENDIFSEKISLLSIPFCVSFCFCDTDGNLIKTQLFDEVEITNNPLYYEAYLYNQSKFDILSKLDIHAKTKPINLLCQYKYDEVDKHDGCYTIYFDKSKDINNFDKIFTIGVNMYHMLDFKLKNYHEKVEDVYIMIHFIEYNIYTVSNGMGGLRIYY